MAKRLEALILNLRGLESPVQRVIVEFSHSGKPAPDATKVIPVRKDDKRYLRLKTAMTTVTARSASTNFDPGLGAEDTHYERALSAFGEAVRDVAQRRGKQGMKEVQAMFDTALGDLQRELPNLESLQPDHPTLGTWQALMRTHLINALTQIQNPPPSKK